MAILLRDIAMAPENTSTEHIGERWA